MSETITRADIANMIHEKMGLPISECSDIVDDIIREMIAALENNEQVKISSFGSFNIKHKNARIGRNPKTMQETEIAARNVVTFSPSDILVKVINKDNE